MEAFIYKITSPNTDKIYIGCTTRTLIRRLNMHKYQKDKSGTTSKEILDAGDATIELIEKVKCNDRKELYEKEREYISSNKNICVNQKSIYKDDEECKKEYQAKHKEEKREYDKKRREELKDKLNEKIQCECGGCYLIRHKSTHIKTKKHLNYSKV